MRPGFTAAFILLFLFASTGSLGGERRPIVAVFEIQARRAGLKKGLIRSLTEYLGTAISEGGAYRVVPSGDIRRALLKKTKETYKECYDQKCQIELGQELAANKTLSTSILRFGGTCVVTCRMYDLKTKATDVSAKAKGKCGEAGLMESIDRVASEIRAWGSGGAGFEEEDLGEKPSGDWDVGAGHEVIVRFESDPAGAVVLVDGNITCRETPCQKSLRKGPHRVSMKAERHRERKERLVVSEGAGVNWKLEPNFGWLTVRSEPSRLDVTVNGTKAGRTPIERSEREPGVYRVLVTSPCHYDEGKKVKVVRGKEREVSVSLNEKRGAVLVKARDRKGDDVAADVYVDGRKVGRTPGTFKVSVCAKELEVRHRKHGTARKALSIRERKVTSIDVKLEGGGGVEWVYSRPAGIEFTKSEVTIAQYRACVQAGKCAEPKSKSKNKYCNWGHSGRDNHPVNCVDWNQATAFCEWAGGRLPTEDEWYAEASNGGKRKYPWGDAEVTCDYAVWGDGKRTDGCGRDSTWPVCSKPAGKSVSGLCDMSGNLWEWTSSLYKSGSSARVLRGGSWLYDDPEDLRASYRNWYDPTFWGNYLGFRCGRSSR